MAARLGFELFTSGLGAGTAWYAPSVGEAVLAVELARQRRDRSDRLMDELNERLSQLAEALAGG